MITIFCEKWRFFLKNECYDQIFLLCFESKTPIFSPIFWAERTKNHNIGHPVGHPVPDDEDWWF
jgi:hypothetical protein